jgi:hypothetical protein
VLFLDRAAVKYSIERIASPEGTPLLHPVQSTAL